MTSKQELIIAHIENLIMQLSFSDKDNRAKGEIEDLKRSLRETQTALSTKKTHDH